MKPHSGSRETNLAESPTDGIKRSRTRDARARTSAPSWSALALMCPAVQFSSVQFSYCINNRQPNGSLSKVLSRLAVGVRVDGDDETQRKEHEREGDQEETRHRVLACVPSEYR